MAVSRGRPAFATDDWMREQQLRAEAEAEGWRRMRQKFVQPEPETYQPLPAAAVAAAIEADPHRSGSLILKALVRFMLAALAAYLAWIAGIDARLGEFDVWMVSGSTFAIALALSMFGPARGFVHAAAETLRWVMLIGIGLGALYLAVNWAG